MAWNYVYKFLKIPPKIIQACYDVNVSLQNPYVDILTLNSDGMSKCLSHKSGGLLNGTVHYKSSSREIHSSYWLCKKWIVWNQEEDFHQNPIMMAEFQSPALWKINFCHLHVTQSVVIFYSSWNGLKQSW